MRRSLFISIVLAVICVSLVSASWPRLGQARRGDEPVEWPQWRGPSRDGVSTEKGLPTTWSATNNVAWKLPLPAYSGSTPIVWNDTLFLNVATARDTGQIELWAVDRRKQAVAWKRQLSGENRTGRNRTWRPRRRSPTASACGP
jgi:hypothetical protein